jgi:hypothetical protein
MPLNNPTRPGTGVAIRAAVGTDGAAAAAAAAAVWLVSALLAALTVNACAVGAALDSATAVDGFEAVAPTASTPTDVVVVALTGAACVEFDLDLAGVDVVESGSGAGVAGGVLG